MSRARVAAAAHRFLKFSDRHSFRVESGGPEKGVALIRAHPSDLEEVQGVFEENLLRNLLARCSEGLVLHSTFSTSFQAIAISGLYAGRGLEATDELFARVLPSTPQQMLYLAKSVQELAEQSLRLVQARGGGGKLIGGEAGGGADVGADGAGADADAESSGTVIDTLGDIFDQFS